MKKVFSIMLVSLLIGFIGCSSDDEKNSSYLDGSIWIENRDATNKMEISFYTNTCDILVWFEGKKQITNYDYKIKGSTIEMSNKHDEMTMTIKNDKISYSSEVYDSSSEKLITINIEFIRK